MSARLFDRALGLSVIAWAWLALFDGQALPLAVRVPIATMNACVGVLLLVRSAAIAQGEGVDLLRALPSIVSSGVAYALATPVWPVGLMLLHAAFALAALASLATLGTSFAIFPARRAIVAHGPYRLVRHPIYLAELGMVVTACATRGWALAWLALALVLALALPRILAEEKLLSANPDYASYRARVRHRLLPGIF